MKLPKKLLIGSYAYSLRYAKKGELGEGHEGELDLTEKTILIRKGLTPLETMHTILHEVKHAQQYETGLLQIIDKQAREMDAESMASVLVANFEITFKKGA